MNKNILITCLLVLVAVGWTSCDDKDPVEKPKTETQKQIEAISAELAKVPEVSTFAKAFKNVNNIDESVSEMTVLAFKNSDAATQRANISESNVILMRHIIKGKHDITNFTTDSLKLTSISGEMLAITRYNNQILVNGIPLSKTEYTAAGNSYIYVVDKIVPDIKEVIKPKYTFKIEVFDCNEQWQTGAQPYSPSENAKVRFYRLVGANLVQVDSVVTNTQGGAVYNHNYDSGLFCMIENFQRKPLIDGYVIGGIFTSQTEIDNYPKYKTNTDLDNLKPGSLKLLDLNGDGIIDKQDQLALPVFMVDNSVEKETVYLATDRMVTVEVGYEELLQAAKVSLPEKMAQFVKFNYLVDYRLMLPDASYPSLSNLSQTGDLWTAGYQYINMYLNIADRLESANAPASVKAEWEKLAPVKYAELSYIYTTLMNYFGDVPLITQKLDVTNGLNIKRTPKADIENYIVSLMSRVPVADKHPIAAILGQYYANEKDYTKAGSLLLNIVNSGNYSLENKPFDTASNKEVMLGGYSVEMLPMLVKGKYIHPVRYREVLLTVAEAYIKVNNLAPAITYINQMYAANALPNYAGASTQEALTVAIRELWKTEMVKEGFDYMMLNRWDTLLDVLGQYGAQAHNKLLPIPQREIDRNPGSMTQNPGY